tara:strand:+ start:339 stop:599 length:261 start_codon:yes stop_codon:yes gene_type:complete
MHTIDYHKGGKMRFISIERRESTDKVLVNVHNIASIEAEPYAEGMGYQQTVVLCMANGRRLNTKFTDVEHAVDYIQRAPSVSLRGR